MGCCASEPEEVEKSQQKKAKKITIEKSTIIGVQTGNFFDPASYSAERLTCGICFEDYDLGVKCPMMICGSQHSICKRCLKDITKKEMSVCPFCKEELLSYIAKNRLLVELVQENKREKREKQEEQLIQAAISNSNTSLFEQVLNKAGQCGYEQTMKLISSQAFHTTIIDQKNSHLTSLIDLSLFQHLKYLMLSADAKDQNCTAYPASQINITFSKNCGQLKSNSDIGLGFLPKLSQLYIRYRHLHRIPTLGVFPMIESLGLGRNGIFKIQNLSNFHSLKYLYLTGNNISKIQNLDNLTNLQFLQLSSNNIFKIQNLVKLSKLLKLWLHNNKIKTIENIESLILLQQLDLDDNNIAIVQNVISLPNLTEIQLKNNPVDVLGSKAELQQLKDNGIDLYVKYGWSEVKKTDQ